MNKSKLITGREMPLKQGLTERYYNAEDTISNSIKMDPSVSNQINIKEAY